MKLNELKDKKILILGFGKEGRDTLRFLKKLFPRKTIGIADKQDNLKSEIQGLRLSNINLHLGKDYLKSLAKYDVIIKSPGIPFKILLKSSLKKVITQTDIFFDNCPGTIVGITGTKGKSTTSALIYAILKEGKIKAHLVGNIGTPVLSFLSSAKLNDVYIYELSSHQLYNLKKSPHIAVFLNIFREHLDYYRSFQEYAKAKANITKYQTKNDYLIYNSGDKLVSQIASKSKAKIVPIKGEYYDLDKNAARAVGEIFNSDAQGDRSSDQKRRRIPKEKIEKAIKKFKPLKHRLENIGTFEGITFYDDALSTIPETAIFAIKALGNDVQTIMLGGYDRGIDFKKLAEKVSESKIENLIFFPTTGEKIWKAIRQAPAFAPSSLKLRRASRATAGKQDKKLPKAFFVDNMKDAVKIAYKNTSKGKICLLSCASTSFSIFKDYNEKGDLFKKFVKFYRKSN